MAPRTAWIIGRAGVSTVIVFLTGAGNSNPPLDDGQLSPDARPLASPVSVSFDISGPVPEPGTVLYAGPAPGLIAGLTQVNIQLPPAPSVFLRVDSPPPHHRRRVHISALRVGGVKRYFK